MTIFEIIGDRAEAARWFAAAHATAARYCACGCGRTIRPNEPLELMGDGRLVLADCYYAAFGRLDEARPTGPGRRIHSACA